MPTEKNPAQMITYLYNKQNTVNVPSWSPDSRHLAFVSNSNELE
jgi:Tol biopolymer transport system component